mmetsp:Transcript_6527/g.11345  ORF Transcript_6527/g.11345 Transcript_6527/m.11345 type:complete len:156 (+) Transcript_6527:69-536(+)
MQIVKLSILVAALTANLGSGQYVDMETDTEGLAHQLARFAIYSLKHANADDGIDTAAMKGFRLAKVTKAREKAVSGMVYDVACESKKNAELKMRFFEHVEKGTFQMTAAKLKKRPEDTAINLLAGREFPFTLDRTKFSPHEFKRLSAQDKKRTEL